jgi:hypothetical protein
MPVTCYYPVVPSDGLPTWVRRYHYLRLPPPARPAEFMEALRRGLRCARRRGVWGKLKTIGWRILRGCYLSVRTSDIC